MALILEAELEPEQETRHTWYRRPERETHRAAPRTEHHHYYHEPQTQTGPSIFDFLFLNAVARRESSVVINNTVGGVVPEQPRGGSATNWTASSVRQSTPAIPPATISTFWGTTQPTAPTRSGFFARQETTRPSASEQQPSNPWSGPRFFSW